MNEILKGHGLRSTFTWGELCSDDAMDALNRHVISLLYRQSPSFQYWTHTISSIIANHNHIPPLFPFKIHEKLIFSHVPHIKSSLGIVSSCIPYIDVWKQKCSYYLAWWTQYSVFYISTFSIFMMLFLAHSKLIF